MPGKPVSPAVRAELQRQLNHELAAAHAYHALAVWCHDQNLKGFSRYFYKQMNEERVHAQKFIDHLLARGIAPPLGAIAVQRDTFDSILDVAQHAQEMERQNTAGIHQAYDVAVNERDYPAQVLLHWFINEQVEEEDWTDEMVERVMQANCAGGMSDLDRHIERYLKDEPSSAATAE
jgi:ferritin